MTDREARAARNQECSLAAFLAKKAEFDTLLAELAQASDDHFGADPETVLWGEAAWLSDATAKLKDIADQHFRRGEQALRYGAWLARFRHAMRLAQVTEALHKVAQMTPQQLTAAMFQAETRSQTASLISELQAIRAEVRQLRTETAQAAAAPARVRAAT